MNTTTATKSSTRARFALAITVLALAAGACGSQEANETTKSEPTKTSVSTTAVVPTTEEIISTTITVTVGPSTRWEGVFDLRDAAASVGVDCPGWDVHASPKFALEQAKCSGTIVFGIYENATEAEAAVERSAGLA